MKGQFGVTKQFLKVSSKIKTLHNLEVSRVLKKRENQNNDFRYQKQDVEDI